MPRIQRLGLILLALLSLSAVKVRYGGEISVRLNEPASFTLTSSSYSDMIFYSLIYDNFFYLSPAGEISSHIFDHYMYHGERKQLVLSLKDNLSFSNGQPVTVREVRLSLNIFLNQNLSSAKRLRKVIKDIHTGGREIFIDLLYDRPDIVLQLTVPELVLLPGNEMTFSGMFIPEKWVKNEYMLLKANPYYAGGRPYLDAVRVVFQEDPRQTPDLFLSNPGRFKEHPVQELPSGIYQNVYICFPKGKVGKNTRAALYTLLRSFYASQGGTPLNSLTSDDESPVVLEIRQMPARQMRSILRHSRINLYILSSLGDIEVPFREFLARHGVRIDLIFIVKNQLVEYLESTTIEFLLVEKVFRKASPLVEKVKSILQELSFARFDEGYLKLLNELDEVQFLKDEELVMDQVSRVVERIIQDGFLLPLSQTRYSLYARRTLQGLTVDYYGRPMLQRLHLK